MDINALKEKLQQLNRRTNKANDIWKPKDEHEVRLVPYPHGPDPFNEVHFHYDVGDNPPIVCPKMNRGEECAICDFAELLRAWKDPEGRDKPETVRKQDFEIFKKIQAKARIFVPMVERGKEAELAKFWGVTPNQSLKMLEVCMDGDRLADLGIDSNDAKRALDVIFNPAKGYDLKVSFRKPGEKGNAKTFTEVVIDGRIRATPLAKDKALVEKILGSVKRIDEIYPCPSSEEVQRMLDKWAGSSQKDDSDQKEPAEKYPTNSSERADKKGGLSIDEAFGSMVGDGADPFGGPDDDIPF